MIIKRILFAAFLFLLINPLAKVLAADGDGSATLAPSDYIPAGDVIATTMTFTITSSIHTGGKIAMQIPDGVSYPYLNGGMYPSPGAVTTMVQTASPNPLTFQTSSQMVIGTVNSGYQLNTGDTVTIVYQFSSCWMSSFKFHVFSQTVSTGSLIEVAGSPFVRTLVPGGAKRIGFKEYNLAAVIDTVTPIILGVQDNCNNPATLPVDLNMTLSSIQDTYPYDLDTIPVLSTSSNFTAPSNTFTVTLPLGTKELPFYYKLSSADNAPWKKLQLTYQEPGNTFLSYNYSYVQTLTSGLTNLSVDTGDPTKGSSHVTFTPDYDGLDDNVYINYTLPMLVSSHVDISSDNFNSVLRTMWAYQNQVRISWDGRSDWSANAPSVIVPAGTYQFRIVAGGQALVDKSLSATLQTNQITGTVTDKNGNPIESADINVFGPSGQYTRTLADGTFSINGLRTGTYNLEISKAGYELIRQSNLQITGSYLAGTIRLGRQSVLVITATRPASGYLPEVWGGLDANEPNGPAYSHANLHFANGISTGDSGNWFGGTASTFTMMSLAPGTTYTVRLNMPGYSAPPFQIMLDADQTASKALSLKKSGNIYATLNFPGPVTDANSWVNIEAGLDSKKDGNFDSNDSTTHLYSGSSLAIGTTSANLTIFGVPDGTYLLRATSPGLVRTSTFAVVAGGQDATGIVFPTFSVGSVIVGTITINGDTTSLSNGNGQVAVNVNVNSPTTFMGAWQQVMVPTNTVTASANFTLRGLEDGDYNSWIGLSGFETSPRPPFLIKVQNGMGGLNVTLNQFNGSSSGTITLPGGNSDYQNVLISLQSYDSNLGTLAPVIDTTTHMYSVSHLGSGYYSLRAIYNTTGFIFEKSFQILNGHSMSIPINLQGLTYSIKGTVKTKASAPYNSLDYLVNQTTPTIMTDILPPSHPVSVPAGRIVAKRYNKNQDTPSGQNTYADKFSYDPTSTFFGFYDSQTGTYTINNLSPGTYFLFNNGEMDGDISDYNEIAEIKGVVNVINADLTNQDFELIDGFQVSGSIRLYSSQKETNSHQLILQLKNNTGDILRQIPVNLLGDTVSFIIPRIPTGIYTLTLQDGQWPKKYSSPDLSVQVQQSDVSNLEVKLYPAAQIQGKMRLKKSGQLLTKQNYSSILPSNFNINAESDPWFPGGYGNSDFGNLINDSGLFSVPVGPGTYKVVFRTDTTSGVDSSGKNSFVIKTVGGVTVSAGDVKDIGVIDLIEADSIQGTVTDKNDIPLANVIVRVYPAGTDAWGEEAVEGTTNELGKYSIAGVDKDTIRYYDVICAPRPQSWDTRFQQNDTSLRYGEIRRLQVDTQLIKTIDFKLDRATGVLLGKVATPDGGPLITSMGGNIDAPGADLILGRHGAIPSNNPLGDIEETSNQDGSFALKGLIPGVYDLYAICDNYRSAIVRNIVIDSSTDLGTVYVATGTKISGTIKKADGSYPSRTNLDGLLAIRAGFEELVFGNLTVDGAQNVTGYSITGFDPMKTYTIIGFPKDSNDLIVLKDSVQVSQNTTLDLVIQEHAPSVFSQAHQVDGSSTTIQFDFTKALRNTQPEDNDPTGIVTKLSALGTLTFDTTWISSDRQRIVCTYTPAAGETSFELLVSATFTAVNSQTGLNYSISQPFTFYTGIGGQKTVRITNANGGVVGLDDDPSKFIAQAGTFGSDSTQSLDVVFRKASDSTSLVGTGGAAGEIKVMKVAKALGPKAYPLEMGRAIIKAQDTNTNPLSSFYDIFLPQGVSHFFPTGKEAQICLQYTGSVTDPSSANIYYYNSTSNEYLIEKLNKTVDTDNKRICASISHASVFTILASSDSVITSTSAYEGNLAVINYPNPFNLKSKTVTLKDVGSTPQTINGTMIKVSAPASISGAGEIQIFNVAGEKVRTMQATITGGQHNYFEWDGKNDHGENVASGTFLARLTIAGSNEKFFKMAVLK